MLVQRKVAQIIFGSQGGKPEEFNRFWPLPDSVPEHNIKTWGTKEEAAELRRRIEKAHGIKLSHE